MKRGPEGEFPDSALQNISPMDIEVVARLVEGIIRIGRDLTIVRFFPLARTRTLGFRFGLGILTGIGPGLQFGIWAILIQPAIHGFHLRERAPHQHTPPAKCRPGPCTGEKEPPAKFFCPDRVLADCTPERRWGSDGGKVPVGERPGKGASEQETS